MIPGVSFDDLHCFDDLGMILADKEIGSPEVQTRLVDVPGRNGPLDMTEALTGDVRYGSRPITLTFVTNEYVSKQGWEDLLVTVEDAIHGQRKEIMFDDGGYSYTGRCAINEFTTSWGKQTIVVDCTCDPFPLELDKFAFYSATDNSLNFQCGHIPAVGDKYKGKTVTAVYDSVEATGASSPPWYSYRDSVKSVIINASFAAARPTSCYRWFYGFSSAAFSGLGNLNTSSVTNMGHMFYNCSVDELNISGFDTASVTTMNSMFYGCSGLTSLNVNSFDTSSVTNMGYMFYNCSKLTSLSVGNFDTSKVTSTAYMFSGCSGLTTLDVSRMNTAKVTSMTSMFYGCSKLTTIYSDDDVFVTNAVTSGGSMFTSCSKLVGGNGTTYSSSNVTYTMAHVDTASNPGYFTGK